MRQGTCYSWAVEALKLGHGRWTLKMRVHTIYVQTVLNNIFLLIIIIIIIIIKRAFKHNEIQMRYTSPRFRGIWTIKTAAYAHVDFGGFQVKVGGKRDRPSYRRRDVVLRRERRFVFSRAHRTHTRGRFYDFHDGIHVRRIKRYSIETLCKDGSGVCKTLFVVIRSEQVGTRLEEVLFHT